MVMKSRKHIATFLLPIGLSLVLSLQPAASSLAQQRALPTVETREDFTDEELRLFVKVRETVSEMQAETQEKTAKAIEKEGLTVERFNEILEARQDPAKSAETSREELNSFNNAAQVVVAENQKAEEQMLIAIEKEGMNIHTYREIMVAYEQSPRVKRRIDALMTKAE